MTDPLDRFNDLNKQGFMKRKKSRPVTKYSNFAWCKKCKDRHAGIARETSRGPEIIKCNH